MPPVTHPLAGVQRWMQAVMTHSAGPEAGAAAGSIEVGTPAWRIDDVIVCSRQLSSEERLEIYANAYTARLLEVLASEFPALQNALGEELFRDFALGYLDEFPSSSYTLADLGRSFPEFLTASRPPRDGEEPDWADFLIDLARLERVYAEVFDGPGTEGNPPLEPAAIQRLSPEIWATSRLTPAPSLRFLVLQFPVHEYVTAIRRQQSPEIPAPSATHLVISRREFVVRRAAVSPLEFRVLRALAGGAAISDALELAVAGNPAADDESAALRIHHWFEEWFRASYFTAIRGGSDGEVDESAASTG